METFCFMCHSDFMCDSFWNQIKVKTLACFFLHSCTCPNIGGKSHSIVSDSLQPHGLYSPWNSRPEYWSGYSFPSPGDLPNPEIKPRSPTLQADSLPTELSGKPKHYLLRISALPLSTKLFFTNVLVVFQTCLHSCTGAYLTAIHT